MTAVERPVPVIAIGSSANGLQALRAIVASLPRALPAAVVIVQHLADTGRESVLPLLLARFSRIRVKDPSDNERLEAGTVYIAPPGIHVIVADGHLRLKSGEKVRFARPSVDVLFSSVAEICGAHGAGVLLSGAGRDGAEGLAAIHKAGGTTIVQDPVEARFRGMPSAALALNGHRILPLAAIGPAIAHLANELAAPVEEKEDGQCA